MLRKLNFTDRARIPREAVRITLRRDRDGALTFDPTLDLGGIAAPGGARVFVEAQYRTSYMRFDCGTVAEPIVPADRRLSEIDSDRLVRFRVKVVDARRILAASNDMTVALESGGAATRLPLLPVNFDDLGDQIWRIHFEGEQPVLELNNRIEAIESMARTDPAFFALVYPAAVREILTRFLIIGDGEEWSDLWIQSAQEMTGDAPPPDPDDRRDWIDSVVAAFCGRHRVVDKLRTVAEETP
jgi:hypothetical protein